MKINTLFPSPPCQDNDCDDIKSDIVSIKLKKERKKVLCLMVDIKFEDKFGSLFTNTQNIQFHSDSIIVNSKFRCS